MIAVILWLVLQRLIVVVFVPIPWWGLLILGVVLFLVIDYLVSNAISR